MENQDNLEKKVFTKEEKENYITQWQLSGKSKMKFATENGLRYYTFVNWCDTLLPKIKKESPSFTEVKLPVQKTIFAEVQKGSMSIKFYQPFPLEYFQLLVN